MPNKTTHEFSPPAQRAEACRRRRDLLATFFALPATWPFSGRCVQAAGIPAPIPLSDPEYGPAARRGALCSASNAAGTGLRGEYFARENALGKLLLTRTDLVVDFDSNFEWPASNVGQKPESVRWTGWIKPPVTGRYKFHIEQPVAKLVVAQQTMLRDSLSMSTSGESIDLAAGRFYPVTLELGRIATIKGRIRLEWTSPHGARYLIPRALMFLPSETIRSKR